jgi:hypothetical protein
MLMKSIATVAALAFALGAMPAEAKAKKAKKPHAAKVEKKAPAKAAPKK